MTPDEIVAAARTWLDVPYLKRGRSRAGIDCIGLIVMQAIHWALPHHDEPHYSDWPDPRRRMLRIYARYMVRAQAGDPLKGTVGVFAGNILPCHTGLFSESHGKPHVIHARVDVGRVVEHEWRPNDGEGRLVARFMFPGLEG